MKKITLFVFALFIAIFLIACDNGEKPVPETDKVTVYYYNSEEWSDVYAYAWYGSTVVKPLGEEPGEKATVDSNDWFKVTVEFDDDMVPFDIVFSDGEGGNNKTEAVRISDKTKVYVIFTSTTPYATKALALEALEDGGNGEDVDNIPPLFLDLVAGKLQEIEHLQGVEVDLLTGVRARDNVDLDDVTIEISDLGGYDKDIAGVFELEYKATDKSGNSSTVLRVVTVLESYQAVVDAIVIGDDFFEMDYNNPTSFKGTSSGAEFRLHDNVVQVMETNFYLAQIEEHADDHSDNDGVPILIYGGAMLVDLDGKVVYARYSAGADMEIDANGEVFSGGDINWSMYGESGAIVAGGNMLKHMDDKIDELLPNGGYVVFAIPDQAREFFYRNTFNSEYVGGAMYKADQDIDIKDVVVKFIEDYDVVIPKPDPLDTPVISEDRHILSWAPVDNAKGYLLYVDGVLYEDEDIYVDGVIPTTSIKLLDLELQLTGEDDDLYKLQVVAVSKHGFYWSNSEKSNTISYKMIELTPIAAPVLTLDEETLSWEALDGAEKYEVYVRFGGKDIKLTTTTNTEVNLDNISVNYEGSNQYVVKAMGDPNHSDSEKSSAVDYRVAYVTQELIIGDMITDVAIVTAENYFIRRNATDISKLDHILYAVIGVSNYEGAINEAFSMISIIRDGKFVFARNIINGQTYSILENGWFADSEYTANSAQLVGLSKYIEEGDILLIGKNELNVTYSFEGEDHTVPARDFLAYHLTVAWPFEGSEGWRQAMKDFVDINEVVFSLDFESFDLIKPVLTEEDGIVSWKAQSGAEFYEVYLELGTINKKVATVTNNSFNVNTVSVGYEGNNRYYVKAIAKDGYTDSEMSEPLVVFANYVTDEFTIGGMVTTIAIVTAENYFERRNAGSDYFQLGNIIYLVTGLNEYEGAVGSNAGALALIRDGQFVFSRGVIAKQTYTVDLGWHVDEVYSNNNNQLIGIADYVEAGDLLLIAQNGKKVTYDDGETKTASAREFLAYHLIKSWDSYPDAPTGTDGWRADLVTFIDVKSVEFTIGPIEPVTSLNAPAITVDGNIISWAPIHYATEYNVYVEVAGSDILIGGVSELSFNADTFGELYAGSLSYKVTAVNLDFEIESSKSNALVYNVPITFQSVTINGLTTKVAVVSAENYFIRRNATDYTKLLNYLYVVTGVAEYEGTINEAYSTVALLDSNLNVTFVRNIFAKQTYTASDGWFEDEEYAVNNAQLVELDKYINTGDLLLIGKNGLTVTFNDGDEDLTIDAREFLAHLLVNPSLDFPSNAVSPNGWRASMSEFIDAKDVVITLNS